MSGDTRSARSRAAVGLEAVTFDCRDAGAVARFWSTVLGHPVDDDASPEFAAIGMADGNRLHPAWMFVQVPEDKTAKNRCHPDLLAADHGAVVDRAVAAGARRLGDFDQAGVRWTTLADPEGNEFDVVAG
jgi:hypothetical protein